MDFGDILDEWDKDTQKAYGKKRIKADEKNRSVSEQSAEFPKKEALKKAHPVDIWLRRYGTHDKDSAEDDKNGSPAEQRRIKRGIKPEAVIDLHGLTREDAWNRLEAFFADCYRRGLRKVLIIHGKGTHSDNGSVLLHVVRQFIERNPHAGESGFSDRADGGSGSTWVLLK